MADIKKITGKLQAGEGTVGKLLMEDVVYNDLKITTANLKEISNRLAAGEGTLGKLLARTMRSTSMWRARRASIKNIAARSKKAKAPSAS